MPRLDAIAATDPKKVNFQNTVVALDNIAYQIGLTANRLSLIKETSRMPRCASGDRGHQGTRRMEWWDWIIAKTFTRCSRHTPIRAQA